MRQIIGANDTNGVCKVLPRNVVKAIVSAGDVAFDRTDKAVGG